MAVGYQWRGIEGFPDMQVGDTWTSTHQINMDPLADHGLVSTIDYVGRSDYLALHRYSVVHETCRPWEVRFRNEIRETVIHRVRFHLFMPEDRSFLFADTQAGTCNGLLKRLREEYAQFSWRTRRLDLSRMRQDLNERIVGGWFANLKIADVRSASIHGPTVTESDDWQRYESSGTIRALSLDVEYLGVMRRVLVTEQGAIVLYGTLGEASSLELVSNVNRMVEPYEDP
jgi:hypothetical protein